MLSVTLIRCNNPSNERVSKKLLPSSEKDTIRDPLPSWNDVESKKKILDFVKSVTNKASFVREEDRIAVFDNDGTLWTEQPVYTQLMFAIDRVKMLAPSHPEWKKTQPFKSLLQGDLRKTMAGGQKAITEIIMATHSGITTEEFAQTVKGWIDTARHPNFKRPYTKCVYQPMLELLSYLRANGFKTFVVSGGGVEFMRPWTEKIYGIPTEQIIGSSIKTRYEIQDGKPALIRTSKVDFIDDKEGKPTGINEHIGKRPILAFGNSDGDFQMLEWTTSVKTPTLGLIVHHDDADREFAYDRQSPIGTLDRGLDDAAEHGWIIVSMKNDWKIIFPD